MGRKRIGLLFQFNKNWTGGHYYLLNIIRALGRLPMESKPHIVLFSQKGKRPDLEDVTYDFISDRRIKKPFNLLERVLRKVGVLSKAYVPYYSKNTVSYIYPYNGDYNFPSLRKIKPVYWLPDFQHKYLTQFFSSEEIQGRDVQFKAISEKRSKLVLSSNSAKQDFIKFYPENKNQTFTIPFATILPDFSTVHIDELRIKYNLEGPYFISPNQFWAHKNHLIILESLVLLKAKGVKFMVVFTGNENDYRNPGYLQSLKDFVKNNSLEKSVKFLGFIDRVDQLQLMNNAIGIIQPSFFEGWSTVVEDGKSMNQFIIASSIEVHKEQLTDYPNAVLFASDKSNDLAMQLEKFGTNPPVRLRYRYEVKILDFAKSFMAVMN